MDSSALLLRQRLEHPIRQRLEHLLRNLLEHPLRLRNRSLCLQLTPRRANSSVTPISLSKLNLFQRNLTVVLHSLLPHHKRRKSQSLVSLVNQFLLLLRRRKRLTRLPCSRSTPLRTRLAVPTLQQAQSLSRQSLTLDLCLLPRCQSRQRRKKRKLQSKKSLRSTFRNLNPPLVSNLR